MTLDDILSRHPARQEALLPILHDVQEAFGHVSEPVMRAIAEALNLSPAEVSGVVSFYHDFRRSHDGRAVIKLCRAESCQARGGEAVAARAEAVAGQRVRVETVYCLGLCSVGPNAMLGSDLHARLDPERIAALIGSM